MKKSYHTLTRYDNKHFKLLMIILISSGLITSCNQKQNLNNLENFSVCDSIKNDLLIKNILNIGYIYGFSEVARNRDFEALIPNSLIPLGKNFKTSFDLNIKTIDTSEVKINEGVLKFLQTEFTNDSNNVQIKLIYYGDNGRALNESEMSFKFQSDSCKWTLTNFERTHF